MVFDSSCHLYEWTILGQAIRYRHIRLIASQSLFLGLLILREHSFAAHKR